jgi:hypothetical protein
MPHSFNLIAESSSTVEEFHSAFGDEDYWRARVAAMGNSTLDSLVVRSDGAVEVATTSRLMPDGLPPLVTRLIRGELAMVHGETWNRIDGGRMRGVVSVRMTGVPLSARGTGSMRPSQEGSQLQYAATVDVKVPLVGGPVESFVVSHLAEWLLEVEKFTTAWITENA